MRKTEGKLLVISFHESLRFLLIKNSLGAESGLMICILFRTGLLSMLLVRRMPYDNWKH